MFFIRREDFFCSEKQCWEFVTNSDSDSGNSEPLNGMEGNRTKTRMNDELASDVNKNRKKSVPFYSVHCSVEQWKGHYLSDINFK